MHRENRGSSPLNPRWLFATHRIQIEKQIESSLALCYSQDPNREAVFAIEHKKDDPNQKQSLEWDTTKLLMA